jgi:hypothetical protein
VHRKITSLWGKKKVVLRQTPRAVTPFGGLSVFIEFLTRVGFCDQVRRDLPVHLKSPNAIPAEETFTAFLIAVVAGARRFAHTALLRADRALHALLGMKRFPTDGTIRNLFKRFTQGMVVQMYEPLWAWQLERLAKRPGGYSLDLDSTVFERYGEQQGVKRGYNPRKPGRASHHPLLGVLGEAGFVDHGWLRSGNTRADSGVVVSERGAGEAGMPGVDSGGARRRGFFRSGFIEIPGGVEAELHRGGASDPLAEAGGGTGRGVAGAGRELLGGKVSVEAPGGGIAPDALWWCGSSCEKPRDRRGGNYSRFRVTRSECSLPTGLT